MKVPQQMRDAFKHYERDGFTLKKIEHRKGTHAMVWLNEISTPILMSIKPGEFRSIKNTLALMRRLRREGK